MDITPPRCSSATQQVVASQMLDEGAEYRDTFSALRQLSKEVHEILVVHNRELNQAAMWALGRWWFEDTPKRPSVARTFRTRHNDKVSGVLARACRSTR